MDPTFSRQAHAAAAAGQPGSPTDLELLNVGLDEERLRGKHGTNLSVLKIRLRNLKQALQALLTSGKEPTPVLNDQIKELEEYVALLDKQPAQQQQASVAPPGGAKPWHTHGRQQEAPPTAPCSETNSKSKAWLHASLGTIGDSPANPLSKVPQQREAYNNLDTGDPGHTRNNPASQMVSRQSTVLGAQAAGAAQSSWGATKSAPAQGFEEEGERCEVCGDMCRPEMMRDVTDCEDGNVQKRVCSLCCSKLSNLQPVVARMKGAAAAGDPPQQNAKGKGLARAQQQPGGRLGRLQSISAEKFGTSRPATGGKSTGHPQLLLHAVPKQPGGAGPSHAGGQRQGGAQSQQQSQQQPAASAGFRPARAQGARARQEVQQQQKRQQQLQAPVQKKAGSDDDWEPQASQGQSRPTRNTNGRAPRTRVRRTRGSAGTGTEENPIHLLSDEDEAAGAAAAAAAGPSRPARAKAYQSTAQKFEGLKCLFPPPGERDPEGGAVEVTASDLARLDSNEFLNDTVIDFYLCWLRRQVRERLGQEAADRCYFFNSFFYKKLTETNSGLSDELVSYAYNRMKWKAGSKEMQALKNHQKVKNWTKSVDIFSKDYLIVPIHDTLHWSLAIICHPGAEPTEDPEADKTPCILHLDSMQGGHTSEEVSWTLRQYLVNEWNIKADAAADPEARGLPQQWQQAHPGEQRQFTKATIPDIRLEVPRQNNYCDCGLFLCTYVEFFLLDLLPPGINFNRLEALKGYGKKHGKDLFMDNHGILPGFLTGKWFKPENASYLRSEMRRMILRLMAEQGEYVLVSRAGGALQAQLWPAGPPLGMELDWSEEAGKREMAAKLREELQRLDTECALNRHMPPGECMDDAVREKQNLLSRLEVRRLREEQERRKPEGDADASARPAMTTRWQSASLETLAARQPGESGEEEEGSRGNACGTKRQRAAGDSGEKRVKSLKDDSQPFIELVQLGSEEASPPEFKTGSPDLVCLGEAGAKGVQQAAPSDGGKRKRKAGARRRARSSQVVESSDEDEEEEGDADEGGNTGAGPGGGGGSKRARAGAGSKAAQGGSSDSQPDGDEGREGKAPAGRTRKGNRRQPKNISHRETTFVGRDAPAERQQQPSEDVVDLLSGGEANGEPAARWRQQGMAEQQQQQQQQQEEEQVAEPRRGGRTKEVLVRKRWWGDGEAPLSSERQQQQQQRQEHAAARERERGHEGSSAGLPAETDAQPTLPADEGGVAGLEEIKEYCSSHDGGADSVSLDAQPDYGWEEDFHSPPVVPGAPASPEWERVVRYNTKTRLDTGRLEYIFHYDGGQEHIASFPGDAPGKQRAHQWLEEHIRLLPARCEPGLGNGGATPQSSLAGAAGGVAAYQEQQQQQQQQQQWHQGEEGPAEVVECQPAPAILGPKGLPPLKPRPSKPAPRRDPAAGPQAEGAAGAGGGGGRRRKRGAEAGAGPVHRPETQPAAVGPSRSRREQQPEPEGATAGSQPEPQPSWVSGGPVSSDIDAEAEAIEARLRGVGSAQADAAALLGSIGSEGEAWPYGGGGEAWPYGGGGAGGGGHAGAGPEPRGGVCGAAAAVAAAARVTAGCSAGIAAGAGGAAAAATAEPAAREEWDGDQATPLEVEVETVGSEEFQLGTEELSEVSDVERGMSGMHIGPGPAPLGVGQEAVHLAEAPPLHLHLPQPPPPPQQQQQQQPGHFSRHSAQPAAPEPGYVVDLTEDDWADNLSSRPEPQQEQQQQQGAGAGARAQHVLAGVQPRSRRAQSPDGHPATASPLLLDSGPSGSSPRARPRAEQPLGQDPARRRAMEERMKKAPPGRPGSGAVRMFQSAGSGAPDGGAAHGAPAPPQGGGGGLQLGQPAPHLPEMAERAQQQQQQQQREEQPASESQGDFGRARQGDTTFAAQAQQALRHELEEEQRPAPEATSPHRAHSPHTEHRRHNHQHHRSHGRHGCRQRCHSSEARGSLRGGGPGAGGPYDAEAVAGMGGERPSQALGPAGPAEWQGRHSAVAPAQQQEQEQPCGASPAGAGRGGGSRSLSEEAHVQLEAHAASGPLLSVGGASGGQLGPGGEWGRAEAGRSVSVASGAASASASARRPSSCCRAEAAQAEQRGLPEDSAGDVVVIDG